MNKYILTLNDVDTFVSDTKYRVKNALLSRCIDGRYTPSDMLPALGFPGADPGQLGVVLAALHTNGIEGNKKKIFAVLTEVVEGVNNLHQHTDSHADQTLTLGGCGHIKQASTDPEAYSLTTDDIAFIKDSFGTIRKSTETVLHGDHQEGAVLLLKGTWGVQPQATIQTQDGKKAVQVFVFHSTFATHRNKVLAQKLVESNAVILPDGTDVDYLERALNEETENHLMETAKRLAKGLPIYEVTFANDGSFSVKDLGTV